MTREEAAALLAEKRPLVYYNGVAEFARNPDPDWPEYPDTLPPAVWDRLPMQATPHDRYKQAPSEAHAMTALAYALASLVQESASP